MDNPIDLYDTPIDLRPLPKFSLEFAIEYLRDHGDHYGASLLTEYGEDTGNIERAREEASEGTVRTSTES